MIRLLSLTVVIVLSVLMIPVHGIADVPTAVWELDPSKGTTVHRGILGHTWEFQLQSPLKAHATVMRGVAGGLAAENFDWRTAGRQRSGGKWASTLQFLRDCRDNQWEPLITTNMRGLLDPERSGQFRDTDPKMLAQLAADWVRYTNHIVHTYRQGDTIESPDDRRIVESISWEGEDALLAPGEAAVPRVQYWEVGNEPAAFAGNLPNGAGPHVFTHRPDDYVLRYKTISEAIVKADPNARVGPCFADDFRDLAGRPFVMAALKSDARIDFISYHKYAHLMHGWPDEGTMLGTLHDLRREMDDRHARCIAAIRTAGRDPASIDLALTEFNAASWGMNSPQMSMARALGTAVYYHQLIDKGYRLATHWDRLAFDNAPWPTALLMQRYVRDLGAVSVGRYRDDSVDLIATRASEATDTLMIWGYNLDPRAQRRVKIRFGGGSDVESIDVMTLGPSDGVPSLLSRNTPAEPGNVRWSDPKPVPNNAGGDVEIASPPLSVTQWRVKLKMTPATLMPQTFVEVAAVKPGEPQPNTPQSGFAPRSASAKELRATAADGGVRLQWELVATGIARQIVERCDDEIEFNAVKELDPSVTTFVDPTTEPGASYQYRIVTRTAAGASAYSQAATVSVPPSSATPRTAATRGVALADARLLAHWPFNQASGLKNDAKPDATSEAFGGASIQTTDGRQSLRIDRGAYVRLDDPPALPLGPGSEATIAFWILTKDHRGVVLARNESHDGPAAYEYGIMLDPPGRTRWMSAVHVRSFKTQIGASTTPIADGKWHHVAITFCGSTGRFYVDGKPAGEFHSLERNVALKHPLLIGANRTWRPDLINPGVTMSIADLRFYNRALNPEAVSELGEE